MKKGIQLQFRPYDLLLKHVFSISGSSRTQTPVVLVELHWEGLIGYGEASLPPYLGESQESVSHFLSSLELSQFNDPLHIDEILAYVDHIEVGNHTAKAAIDIALHDLIGKIKSKPLHQLWNLNKDHTPYTSFTIGMDDPGIIRKKVEEAGAYKILKVKLGGGNDREMIETIRSVWNGPLYVDVNQGWTDRVSALEMIHWLKEMKVDLIEQPLPKGRYDDTAWLTQQSPIPVVGDEDVQRLDDVRKLNGVYSGINIKLMKCTGLAEARKMINLAEKQEMHIMLGCMTETSVAISAMAQLSPKARWADLDGNLLITNDPFSGTTIKDGKVILNQLPGIGVRKI